MSLTKLENFNLNFVFLILYSVLYICSTDCGFEKAKTVKIDNFLITCSDSGNEDSVINKTLHIAVSVLPLGWSNIFDYHNEHIKKWDLRQSRFLLFMQALFTFTYF